MKQTRLSFIQQYLFDEEIKKEVTHEILERGHQPNLRVKFNFGTGEGKIEAVPQLLTCKDINIKCIWVLIRALGDIELRTVTPLDPNDEDASFEATPLGIQRAISIWIPKDPMGKVGWRVYNSVPSQDTGDDFLYGMKTFTQERKPANSLNFEERERLKAKRLK